VPGQWLTASLDCEISDGSLECLLHDLQARIIQVGHPAGRPLPQLIECHLRPLARGFARREPLLPQLRIRDCHGGHAALDLDARRDDRLAELEGLAVRDLALGRKARTASSTSASSGAAFTCIGQSCGPATPTTVDYYEGER